MEGASGELQPNQSRGESESAPVTGKSHQDDDKDIETHEKEGHWTLVDRGKKSPKSPEAIQPEKTDQGAENPKGPPACRLLRRLPKDRREFAVPEFEDERHTVTRPDGSVVTVFAPEWVPIEKIRKAIIDWKAIDWGVVRPTSRREDKWVYFPPEDQELLKKCK